MDKRDLGEEIKNIVQNAFNNDDFRRLNKDIQGVVKGALSEVRKSVDWVQKNSQSQNDKQTMSNTININKSKSNMKEKGYTVPIGQVSGILFTVFGAIGSGIFGVTISILTILGFTLGAKGVFHGIGLVLLPLLVISMASLVNGRRIQKRLKRFQCYIGRMHNKSYSSIKELSYASGLSPNATVKDLKKMIAIGMFPQGHLDDKGTYFMLNNECYEEYLKLQEGIKSREMEKKAEPKVDSEINKALEEGRRLVSGIRNANDIIPGEEISHKLDRLEEVTGKIFDYVENHPEKLPEIKKFTEYFLPTTLKLIDGYKKLDYQPIEGQNILNAKREIEETMDTIILAFENLLDDLFVDIAMDISTDISVLETMFAQEGLTTDNLRQKK